jgi:hypothetical protein
MEVDSLFVEEAHDKTMWLQSQGRHTTPSVTNDVLFLSSYYVKAITHFAVHEIDNQISIMYKNLYTVELITNYTTEDTKRYKISSSTSKAAREVVLIYDNSNNNDNNDKTILQCYCCCYYQASWGLPCRHVENSS